MNPEYRVRLPDRDIDEIILRDACRNLACAIIGGRWTEHSARRTSMTRSYSESLAFLMDNKKLVHEDEYDTPDLGGIVDFAAVKTDPWNEYYRITSHQMRSVQTSFLAYPLLERIIAENNGSEQANRSYYGGFTAEDLLDEESKISVNAIDTYTIDQDGDILLYELRNKYSSEDNETELVDEQFMYQFAVQSDTVLVKNYESGGPGRAHERHSSFLRPLEEASLPLETIDLDQKWRDTRLLYDTLDRSIEVAGVSLGEHYRRVIAPLALSGQGILSMNKLIAERNGE